MNKYNPKELKDAIRVAINKGVKEEGMYNCLMLIPSNKQNEEGYVDAKRFGYNADKLDLDYLGDTDVMPWDINYKDYCMDFVPGGVNLFRKDKKKFKVSSICYCDTVIGE